MHINVVVCVLDVKSVVRFDLRGLLEAKVASEVPKRLKGIFQVLHLLTRCAELESCSRSVLAVDDGSCTAAADILLSECCQIKM